MGFRRILALVLSAIMLLTPVMTMAEAPAFSAGDLTLTTIAESYSGGYQINVSLGFDVDTNAVSSMGEKTKAAAVLLEKAKVDLSFYDDFGTARIRGALAMDGVELVNADMLVFEDGSVQLLTSLTGNMAFTLPAGAVSQEGLMRLLTPEWTMENAGEMSPFRRLSSLSQNMLSTLINLLLGWVSATQMETGELYVFDYDSYIDATAERDAVATRMIGKIRSSDLIRFVWGIVAHIRDREHEFQSALAYSIAEFGVTRYQARQLTDSLFPEDAIDHEQLGVTPSSEIADDGAPVMYWDVYYFLCKLEQNLMNAWGENTIDNTSSMIVSYDDYGEMVGLDIGLNRVSRNYPYEGDFVYSRVTDENWQYLHTAHGELQVQDNKRVIGDLALHKGEDVGGTKAHYLNGQMDLVNRSSGESVGFGVNSSLNFVLSENGESESIEANADLMLNITGESSMLLDTNLSAVSELTDTGLVLSGQLNVGVMNLPQAAVNVTVTCGEYDEAPFEGGQAVDLSGELTQEQLDKIKSTVKSNAAALGVKLAFKPAVLGNLLKLTGGLLE
ncbi:MAG: hypothetical protein IKU34_10475 [Clostridia bacterium]|nr:hypothetical protein [Clostridia bacterium]